MPALRNLVALAVPLAPACAQSFCDDTMANWVSLAVSSAGHTFSTAALPTGGTTTPPCLEFTQSLDGTTPYANIYLAHLPADPAAAFNLPNCSTATTSIDLRVDVRAVVYTPAIAFGTIAFRWAAWQNGTIYLSGNPGYWTTGSGFAWLTRQDQGLSLDLFRDPLTNAAPDFANGPITFGVMSGNSCWHPNGCGIPLSATGRIDSFCVSIRVAPTVVQVGPGCRGTLGVPGNSAGPARICQPFSNTFSNLPGTAGIFVAGTSSTLSALGPLPFDLGSLGAPTCLLRVSTETVLFVVPGGGTATVGFPMPCGHLFLGMQFFTQCAALDPAANALGLVVSDAAAVAIGN